MIITIDGPAGSGKSTAARELATALNIAYLDTGAMYRAVTLAGLRAGLDLADEQALADLAGRLDMVQRYEAGRLCVFLDGRDVSKEIRSAEVSEKSHYAARAPAVRSILVRLQRRVGRQLAQQAGGVVTEGRDQGSVVFPDADVKFYLDASPEVRAERRFDELAADEQGVTYRQVLEGLEARDGRDRSRALAPLVKPAGAIEIDTTGMSVAQVTAELVRHVKGPR